MGTAESKADRPPKQLRPDGRYTLVSLPCLGGGYNARVFLYKDTCAQGTAKKTVAVKLLRRTSVAKHDQPVPLDPHEYAEKTVYEVLTMWQMRHAHTAKIRELILTPESQSFALALVMEYVPGGDLFEEMRDERLSEAKARWIFQQLILTVDYLHSQGTAHMDIKLSNILLDRHTKPLITLCDFGLAKDVTNSSRSTSWTGTHYYKDPAMYACGDEGYSSKKADILSCGVVLYKMVTGGNRMNAENCPSPRATQEDWSWPYPEGLELTQDCRDLLDAMLTWDPKERASLEDIKNSRWFRIDVPAGFDDYNTRAKQIQEEAQSAGSKNKAQVEASIRRMVNQALETDDVIEW